MKKIYQNMWYMQKKSVCSKRFFYIEDEKMAPDMIIYRNEKNVILGLLYL